MRTDGRTERFSRQSAGLWKRLKWFAVCHGICDVSRSVGWLCDIEGRVLQDRVLVRILGPQRDEVKGGWRAVCSEELHDLSCSLNI